MFHHRLGGPGDSGGVTDWMLEDGDLRLEFVELAPHPVHQAPAWRFRTGVMAKYAGSVSSAAQGAITLPVLP